MIEFIDVSCNGVTKHGDDEIIIFCYGPQGSLRGAHSLTPENAKDLRDKLTKALQAFRREEND